MNIDIYNNFNKLIGSGFTADELVPNTWNDTERHASFWRKYDILKKKGKLDWLEKIIK